jgi:hypothetical protein
MNTRAIEQQGPEAAAAGHHSHVEVMGKKGGGVVVRLGGSPHWKSLSAMALCPIRQAHQRAVVPRKSCSLVRDGRLEMRFVTDGRSPDMTAWCSSDSAGSSMARAHL